MTPDKSTIEERMFDVGDGHQIYSQLWGNKVAKNTIVFLHGGPGSGCSDKQKLYFNPAKHRVIFIDQRGSGRSLPYGSLKDNDTSHLIEDINVITKTFNADKFTIVGGSWGSTLALAYALKYPSKVPAMILRGIFTGRKVEIDFMDKGGLQFMFPEVWSQFLQSVPATHRSNPRGYHIPRILGKDKDSAKLSAYAYNLLEGSVVSLDDRVHAGVFETFDPAPTTIECHYLAQGCFLPEGYIIKNSHKLTMPIHLVQGRYDAVCPPFTAYELSKGLPNATLHWTTAGHSGNDRANWDTIKALLSEI